MGFDKNSEYSSGVGFVQTQREISLNVDLVKNKIKVWLKTHEMVVVNGFGSEKGMPKFKNQSAENQSAEIPTV